MHSTLFTILWIRCARTIHIRTAEATGHRKLAAGLDLACSASGDLLVKRKGAVYKLTWMDMA